MTHEEWMHETTLVQLRLLVLIASGTGSGRGEQVEEFDYLINRAIILTDQAEPGNSEGEHHGSKEESS